MSKLATDLISLLELEFATDFCIRCDDGREFKVHKLVLARSLVFRSMIQSDMAESSSGTVQIKEFNSGAVKEFVEYLYSDRVSYSSPHLPELLKMGHKYQLEELVRTCSSYLSSKVDKENVLELANLAETFDLDELSKMCANFIIQEEVDTEELDGLAPSFLRKLYAITLSSRLTLESFSHTLGNMAYRGVNFHRRVLQKNPICRDGSLHISFEANRDVILAGVGVHVGLHSGIVNYEVSSLDSVLPIFSGYCHIINEHILDSTLRTTDIMFSRLVQIRKNAIYRVKVDFGGGITRNDLMGRRNTITVGLNGGETLIVNLKPNIWSKMDCISTLYICDK